MNIKKRYLAHGNQVNDYSNADITKIKQVLSKYIVTFTQEEAGFKSKINETILYVKMKPSTYKLVGILEKNLVYTGKNGNIILGDTPVKLMQKVHQVFSGTVKTESGDSFIIDDNKALFIKNYFLPMRLML